MRSLISGIVGLALGGMCLLSNLLKGGPQGEGAYHAGQVCGLVMGVLFFFGGIGYLILGLRELQGDAPKKKRRRRYDDKDEYRPRRRRRVRRDDDD
jgi:hypothetical protein